MIFTIDTDNNITAHDATPAAQDNVVTFATQAQLAKAAAAWRIKRLVAIWNSLAGAPPFGDLNPVKKFTDRPTAVARIWSVIQALVPQEATPATPAQPGAHGAPKAAKAARHATGKDDAATPPPRARGQQESHRARHAEAPGRRQPHGDRGRYRLAEALCRCRHKSHTVRGFMSTLP